jgi:hypothetical protein
MRLLAIGLSLLSIGGVISAEEKRWTGVIYACPEPKRMKFCSDGVIVTSPSAFKMVTKRGTSSYAKESVRAVVFGSAAMQDSPGAVIWPLAPLGYTAQLISLPFTRHRAKTYAFRLDVAAGDRTGSLWFEFKGAEPAQLLEAIHEGTTAPVYATAKDAKHLPATLKTQPPPPPKQTHPKS